jgi:hypothetical protein
MFLLGDYKIGLLYDKKKSGKYPRAFFLQNDTYVDCADQLR